MDARYPAEVESTLNAMDSVKESAIVGKAHGDFGEVVIAFVIPADTTNPPLPQDVIAWAKSHLANYKIPKEVRIVSDFPRNAMGKVMKADLRRELAGSA